MQTYADFSSLLQLGVGTGIGLSLFRAPIDLRLDHIEKKLEAELRLLRGATSEFAKKKRSDFLALRYELSRKRRALDRKILPFLGLAVLGALTNLGALIFVSCKAQVQVFPHADLFFIGISTIYFLLLIGALEYTARQHLAELQVSIRQVQDRSA